MYSLLGLLLLAAAFTVLVWTFVWVARLLALRARQRRQVDGELEPVVFPEPVVEPERPALRGRGYGANYGLVLGLLACALFWVSPLMLALSFAGLYYSGRALYGGVRHFRVLIWRALAGSVLGLVSVGLHFLDATDALPALL